MLTAAAVFGRSLRFEQPPDMLKYLQWPSSRDSNIPTSLANEVAALNVPSRSIKGKERATEAAASSTAPSLILQEAEDDSDDDADGATTAFPAMNSIQRAQCTSLALPPSTLVKPAKPRRKVALEPGFSQLDWARLQQSGTNLRVRHLGDTTGFMRITPSELARHRRRDDAWAAFNGRVYNITPYLKFHPGGVGELMRSAGRDGTELFMKTHAWINIDGMLGECCIGMLVRE